MKIAHITSPEVPLIREYGGTEALVCNLVEKQVSEGHEVTVIGSSQYADACCNMISVVKPSHSYASWFLNWLSQRFNGMVHVCKSFTYIDSKFDIIHSHLSEEGIALSFLKEAPCLNTLHGIAHERLPQYCISRLYSITRNTKLVALSKSAYFQHKRFYGDDLIGYVHNGINTRLFKFLPTIHKDSDLELCYSGRISPDKSVKEVIAIADILHNQGVNVHLKLIGKFCPRDKDYFFEIVKMAAKRPYISKLFDISSDQLKFHIANSDVFLFPISSTEPFALAPLEAMACGTPVVALQNGPAIEYVKNGVNGFLCKDIYEMTDATLRYREINRKTCRQIVEDEFSVDNMYKRYLEKYIEVMGIN